jgi:hypothetical protein
VVGAQHAAVSGPIVQGPKESSIRAAVLSAMRLILASVAFGAALIGFMVLPLVAALGRAFGGWGDGFQRFFIGAALLVVGLLIVSIFLFGSWTLREVVRHRSTWVVVAIFALVGAWAAFGVDSTRPLRQMPEAHLAVPEATEISSGTRPAQGGIGRVARAELSRSFEATGRYEEVEAFVRSALLGSGWTYSGEFGSVEGERYISWDRDGFTFQLQLPDPDDPWSGRFGYTIYGPPQ